MQVDRYYIVIFEFTPYVASLRGHPGRWFAKYERILTNDVVGSKDWLKVVVQDVRVDNLVRRLYNAIIKQTLLLCNKLK